MSGLGLELLGFVIVVEVDTLSSWWRGRLRRFVVRSVCGGGGCDCCCNGGFGNGGVSSGNDGDAGYGDVEVPPQRYAARWTWISG